MFTLLGLVLGVLISTVVPRPPPFPLLSFFYFTTGTSSVHPSLLAALVDGAAHMCRILFITSQSLVRIACFLVWVASLFRLVLSLDFVSFSRPQLDDEFFLWGGFLSFWRQLDLIGVWKMVGNGSRF